MRYWIEPRHPEESSPCHPTDCECEEGARLYLDEDKVQRVSRKMEIGDRVFFYETKEHPCRKHIKGAQAIGALVTVVGNPYYSPDSHVNALTHKPEDWKVDCEWKIRLRDWRNGIPLSQIREVLEYQLPWAPRSLLEIPGEAFERLSEELRSRQQAEDLLKHK